MGSGWLDRWRRIRRVVRIWVASTMPAFRDLTEEELAHFRLAQTHAVSALSREEREIANQVYQSMRRDNRP